MSNDHVEAQVAGTGTPPVSPNYGIPRYSGADPADYPTQTNAITDIVDAQAAKRGAIVDADVATGAAIIEAKLSLATDAAPAVGSRRTLGRGANQAMAGNDSRLGTVVTALPASPADGDEIFIVANNPAGVIWHLRYRAVNPGSYKWEFIGGSPYQGLAGPVYNTVSTGWDANGGPTLGVAFSGSYKVTMGALISVSTGCNVSLGIMAAGSVGPYDFVEETIPAGYYATVFLERAINIAAGGVVAMVVSTNAGTIGVANRSMAIQPIQIG